MRSWVWVLWGLASCSVPRTSSDKGDTDAGVFEPDTDVVDTVAEDTDVPDTDVPDTDVQDTGPCAGVSTTFTGDFTIRQMSDIAGLRCVKHITGSLIVSGTTTQIGSLAGLEAIEQIDKALWVSGDVSSLVGLSGLTDVGNALIIESNPTIVSFTGLESLVSIGNLSLQNNTSFASFAGLDALTRMSSPDFTAISNPSLCRSELDAFVQRFQKLCFCQYNKAGC